LFLNETTVPVEYQSVSKLRSRLIALVVLRTKLHCSYSAIVKSPEHSPQPGSTQFNPNC